MKKLALVLACLFSCCQVQAWAESELAVTNVQDLLAGIGSHNSLKLNPAVVTIELVCAGTKILAKENRLIHGSPPLTAFLDHFGELN